MSRVVATPEQAKETLEYFNGFHDGFIKRLTLISHDYFADRGTQVCSGHLELEIVIAHYNYRGGEPPADQIIEARFAHVRDLHADLPGTEAEWSLANVHFEYGTRVIAGREEPCFHARLLQNRLDGGVTWVLGEVLRFSFREAQFVETPMPDARAQPMGRTSPL